MPNITTGTSTFVNMNVITNQPAWSTHWTVSNNTTSAPVPPRRRVVIDPDEPTGFRYETPPDLIPEPVAPVINDTMNGLSQNETYKEAYRLFFGNPIIKDRYRSLRHGLFCDIVKLPADQFVDLLDEVPLTPEQHVGLNVIRHYRRIYQARS